MAETFAWAPAAHLTVLSEQNPPEWVTQKTVTSFCPIPLCGLKVEFSWKRKVGIRDEVTNWGSQLWNNTWEHQRSLKGGKVKVVASVRLRHMVLVSHRLSLGRYGEFEGGCGKDVWVNNLQWYLMLPSLILWYETFFTLSLFFYKVVSHRRVRMALVFAKWKTVTFRNPLIEWLSWC